MSCYVIEKIARLANSKLLDNIKNDANIKVFESLTYTKNGNLLKGFRQLTINDKVIYESFFRVKKTAVIGYIKTFKDGEKVEYLGYNGTTAVYNNYH